MKKRARLKTVRRLGTPLPGLTRKPPGRPSDERPRPGRRRQAKSIFRIRLEEKQKVRFHYGITEGQLRTYMTRAFRQQGPTADNLFRMLERRLDNVVFRLGFAPTIRAARQLVSHGHVQVDGRRVDVPGQLVERGQTVAVGARARAMPGVQAAAASGPEVALPGFLSRDPADPFTGRMTGDVARADVPIVVDDAAVVEYYSR
jgi:small subunit ribosomal protein S4